MNSSALRNCPKHDVLEGLGRLHSLQSELLTWWACLPEDVVGSRLPSNSTVCRARVHLILEFYAVRMFIGRSFIRPPLSDAHVESHPSPNSQESSQRTGSRRAKLRQDLVGDCVEAAMACIDTCRTIRATITLARASYTEFSALRAALLVVTAQCLWERTDRFRLALKDGISMLKEMSTSGRSAQSEYSLLEAFERVVSRIYAASNGAGRAAGESDYGRFKQWEQLWNTQDVPSTLLQDATIPMPPRPNGSWQATDAQSGTLLGNEGNFASFPQTLDDISSFFGGGLDVNSGTFNFHSNAS